MLDVNLSGNFKEALINSCMVATSAWHRSPGFDLRRTRRDLPDLTRNAAHGGVNQCFPNNLHYQTN